MINIQLYRETEIEKGRERERKRRRGAETKAARIARTYAIVFV